jgi:hypothetical protein
MRMRSTAFFALLLAACIPAGPEPGNDGSVVDASSALDAPMAMHDAGAPPPTPTGTFPTHARTLPFPYTRPDVGTPLTATELADETDHYLALLDRTHWFDYMEDRVHGWPESAPGGRYWYATWWSGAGISLRSGHVTFAHVDVGAENNGLRTPQIMEGACYAWLLWHHDQDQHLVRRLVRGLSSWRLAMQRSATDPEIGLTSRAAYPESVDDPDRGVHIDYDPNRPGVDGGASYFIHIPTNPTWGDLYVQAQRSKDDMGHIMRGIAAIDACDGMLTETGAQDDIVQARRLYQEWAQRVERDDFHIATLDASLNVVVPTGQLATYFVPNVECHAQIAIRLLSRNDPFGAHCATPTGASPDPTMGISSSSMQIVRSHHEAAAALALVTGQDALAQEMLAGLAARIEMILDLYDAGMMPDNAHPSDVVQLMVEAANLGVPLTSREVRWLHAQIEIAFAGYDTSGAEWHVFEPGTADGDYAIEPNGPGIDIKDLALLLGTCVAPYRNPAGRAVLDCGRVAAYAR